MSLLLKHMALVAVHIALYAAVWAAAGFAGGLVAAVFAALLIWVSLRDVMIFEVPDSAAVLLIITGVLFAPDMAWAIGAALLWSALYLAVARGARIWLGRDALGLGDVKLMAGLAAWTGPLAPIHITLFASVAAIATLVFVALIRRERLSALGGTGIAFGPFLCLGAWAIWTSGVHP